MTRFIIIIGSIRNTFKIYFLLVNFQMYHSFHLNVSIKYFKVFINANYVFNFFYVGVNSEKVFLNGMVWTEMSKNRSYRVDLCVNDYGIIEEAQCSLYPASSSARESSSQSKLAHRYVKYPYKCMENWNVNLIFDSVIV